MKEQSKDLITCQSQDGEISFNVNVFEEKVCANFAHTTKHGAIQGQFPRISR